MDLTRKLLQEPQIILSDIRCGENFEFTYREYGRDKFLIQAWNRNQFIGVCQIKNGMANLPFDKNYRLDNEHKAALCVSKEIKTRYRGIGTTLLSFAMEICKLNGRDEFNVGKYKKL